MSVGLLNSASSALLATYAQMQTTSHNIANVNTPGYSRQEVLLSTAGASFSGSGYVGRGVNATDVQRRYDQFVSTEVVVNTAQNAADAAHANALSRVDQLFADSASGIGAAYDDLQLALADVATRPGDLSARTTFLSRAQALASVVRQNDEQLAAISSSINQQIGHAVTQANTTLQQIARVNNQIGRFANTTAVPNDLLDERDLLLEQLNGQIKASAFINQDGSATVFALSGQALVLNDSAVRFEIRQSPDDASKNQIVARTGTGIVPFEQVDMGGGALSGLLQARDQDLPAIRGRIGQIASAIAASYNKQQQLGVDLAGSSGAALFAIGAPSVLSSPANQGNARLSASVSDGTQVAASDYQIEFDGSQYSVTRNSDATVRQFASIPIAIDGLAITLASGSVAAGDRFSLLGSSSFASQMRVLLTAPGAVAAALPITAEMAAGNRGDVRNSTFKIVSADPNQSAPVTLTFTSANSFDVIGTGTGNPVGQSYQSNQAIAFNGWSIELNGTPRPGDVVTVSPNRSVSTDNRNIRNMAELAQTGIVSGSRVTDAYADAIADVGTRTSAAKSAQKLSSRLLDSATASRASIAGVNLDEEAAHLLQYQQAYQAAARVMTTAQEMFQALLRVTGG